MDTALARREMGRMAALTAERFVVATKGWEVLERGWECAAGTVGLVARSEDGALHFVQVGMAQSDGRGFEPPGTGAAARRRLEAIAELYLAGHGQDCCMIVFDAVQLKFYGGSGQAMLKWYGNVLGR